MFISRFHERDEIVAGDNCILRELLSPLSDPGIRSRYSLAHAIVKPGDSTLPHVLRSTEVYYVIEGEGMMSIDGEEARVSPGDTVYIPPGARQHIANTGTGDLVFLAIVDPAWRAQDEEVL